jgi:hypothetical protein
MNKPSILKSVSISEMLHMREMGLSNAEIADKIGCSHMTVIRHIGKAPFVKPGRGRGKKESDTLGLPPVGNKPIPEMPHKSFAERLEESYKKPVPVGTVEIPEKVREDIEHKLENDVVPQQTLSHADLAREAHVKALEKTSIPYSTYKEGPSHIPELVAVFGPDAVITWLKVSMYDMGIPDCRPMNRQKMLEMLKIMNAGGASV